MHSFTDSSLRLLKRLLGSRSQSVKSDNGFAAVLDGNSAVALMEAAVSQAAGLGASAPNDIAAMTWRTEQRRRQDDEHQSRLTTVAAEGPRGALASAAGLALSGVRATAFISGQEAASLQDLLATMAGRHLPLVVHVENRATGGASAALGSGHEALHLSAESGCFLLCAANVQEAVDFSLIARRVAEQTLLPGLVFMDREQTAAAPQQVNLPSWQLLEDFLGRPDDPVPSATPAEKLLFGSERRRLPRWHNSDRPVMLGSVQPTEIWGLGKAASRLYLEETLAKSVTESIELFARRSGRQYAEVSDYRLSDAGLILVALGSAIETAEAVADRLRSTRKLKIGVLGIRTVQPFPGGLIAEKLEKAKTVCILERLDSPAASDPPLLRALSAAIGRDGRNRPRLLSVLYGLGGLPLRATDLVELCHQAERIQKRRVYLGVRFDPGADPYPKRQALLDRLRRNYPELDERGLSGSHEDQPDLGPEDAIALAFHRISGTGGDGLALEMADFLWRAAGGELRSRMAHSPAPWGDACIDWFIWAPGELRDPGDRLPVDLAIVTDSAIDTIASGLELNQQGCLLLEQAGVDDIRLPPELIACLQRCGGRLYCVDSHKADGDADLRRERLLGATLGILLARALLETGFRRLLSHRETVLSDLSEDARNARLHAFREGFDQLISVDPATLTALPTDALTNADAIPPQLHRLGNIDDNYDSLPRFWDQTGVLYRDRKSSRLTPDPYLAIGALPPLSAAFRQFDRLRKTLPVLDAEACTGCGACWTLCPDGAVGVTALEPGALLETGMRMTGMEALRPLSSNLSKRMAANCRVRRAAPVTAGELLDGAFDWMLQQSLPEPRKQLLAEAQEKIVGALGTLPMALTDALYREPETQLNGSGTLLFLAVDPAICKGCGICVSNCEPGAMTLGNQTRELAAEAKRNWKNWEQLPETTQATLEQAGAGSLPGKPAATLMAQRFRSSLGAGDGAEPGSGERLALRLLLAAAVARQQPLMTAFIADVGAVREKLSMLIRKMLADALPADDLDALATGLDSVDTRETDLTSFINETEGTIDARIDALRLRRLVSLAQKLRDLSWQLTEGRQGFGRAGLGLVLCSNLPAGWAGVFPDNPFAVPVTVDTTGDAAQYAAGLLQGQLQQALEGFVLMRKARVELESPADAARLWSTLDNLGWDDLTVEERALCPPVIVVGSSSLLAGRGLSQLSGIMAGNLPIKFIVFPELDFGLAAGANTGLPLSPIQDTGMDLALLTLAWRSSLNAQCSVGYPEHLAATVETALNFPGPALIQIHAPSPGRHGFPADQTVMQARLAVKTRTFPLFLYDPGAEGVFGSRFSLAENPDPDSGWLSDESGQPVTTAHWMLGERRFAQWLSRLPADAPDTLPLAEYLALPEMSRAGKKPFIPDSGMDAAAVRYRVKAPLVTVCEERLRCWRTLQEIAGLVTPFTRRVEQQAQQNVAAAHRTELEKMQSSYEARISELKRELLEQSRSEIRMRLMAMAGYDATSEEKSHAPL